MGSSDRAGGAGLSAYRAVLRQPGALAFVLTGSLARLAQAMIGLGTVLMLVGVDRSYQTAGLVAGAVTFTQGVASPGIGRLIDQRGQGWVLVRQIVVHVVALAVLIAAAAQGAGEWGLLGLGVVVGASLPQIGPSARARWSAMDLDAGQLQTALSLESLMDEAVFVIGPVLVTATSTALAPEAGLLLALTLVLIGGLLFARQRRTEPLPRPREPGKRTTSAIRQPGLAVITAVLFFIGVLFGLVEVGVVALTREHGHPGAAGVLLALWATGSLVCGTVYGAIRWHSAPVARFQLAALAMAMGCVLIGVTAQFASLPVVAIALIVAGLANAPTLISANLLVPGVVPGEVVTEAYTWLGVIVFAGIAIGTPVGGTLIDAHAAPAALWASLAAGVAAVAIAHAGRRSLIRAPGPSEHDSRPAI